MTIAYIFFAVIAFFMACMVFYIVRDWWRSRKDKPLGVEQYANLWKSIDVVSHPVELVFITNDIFDWYNDRKRNADVKEMYIEIMKHAHARDVKLKKELNKTRFQSTQK